MFIIINKHFLYNKESFSRINLIFSQIYSHIFYIKVTKQARREFGDNYVYVHNNYYVSVD